MKKGLIFSSPLVFDWAQAVPALNRDGSPWLQRPQQFTV